MTCVSETPEDSVVGMQQNTASPKASSGGYRGRRSATKAARGVNTRMESMPKMTEPHEEIACIRVPGLFKLLTKEH